VRLRRLDELLTASSNFAKEQRRLYKLEYHYGIVRRSTQDEPRRTGVLAMKCGMIPGWDEYGARYPLTVLQMEDTYVTKVIEEEKEGFNAVQLGYRRAKEKHTKNHIRAYLDKIGVPYLRHFSQWKVDRAGLIPLGTKLNAQHFVPGQYVDVQGVSIGKGFQGVMKRWGFKGQPASHGVSLAHRSPGSIGITNVSRVMKGRKMPGKMGNKKVTIENLVVFRIDVERNLIFVAGHVPGKAGKLVKIRDAWKKPRLLWNGDECEYPWPTFMSSRADEDTEKAVRVSQYLEAPSQKEDILEKLYPRT